MGNFVRELIKRAATAAAIQAAVIVAEGVIERAAGKQEPSGNSDSNYYRVGERDNTKY